MIHTPLYPLSHCDRQVVVVCWRAPGRAPSLSGIDGCHAALLMSGCCDVCVCVHVDGASRKGSKWRRRCRPRSTTGKSSRYQHTASN